MVTLLAAGVSLQSDGSRLGEVSYVTKYEVTADLASLEDDFRNMEEQIRLMPVEMKIIWADTKAQARFLEKTTADGAHNVAHRISAFMTTI